MKETAVRLEVQFSWWRRMFVVSVDKEKFLCARMVKCGLRRPRLRGNVSVLHGTGLVYAWSPLLDIRAYAAGRVDFV